MHNVYMELDHVLKLSPKVLEFDKITKIKNYNFINLKNWAQTYTWSYQNIFKCQSQD